MLIKKQLFKGVAQMVDELADWDSPAQSVSAPAVPAPAQEQAASVLPSKKNAEKLIAGSDKRSRNSGTIKFCIFIFSSFNILNIY